jgi:hypothetical protein
MEVRKEREQIRGTGKAVVNNKYWDASTFDGHPKKTIELKDAEVKVRRDKKVKFVDKLKKAVNYLKDKVSLHGEKVKKDKEALIKMETTGLYPDGRPVPITMLMNLEY